MNQPSLTSSPVTPGSVLTGLASGGSAWLPNAAFIGAFNAFAITGQASAVEVGATIASGSKTFTWLLQSTGCVRSSSVVIADTTANVLLATGLSTATNPGSDAISIGAITNNAPASYTWTASATDTSGNVFSLPFSVNWLWKVYSGSSSNAVLNSSQVLALGTSALASAATGSYTLPSGGYGFICVPTSWPAPKFACSPNQTDMFGNPVNPLGSPGDSRFTGRDSNGTPFCPLVVANSQGVSTSYALYRTGSVLAANLALVVT